MASGKLKKVLAITLLLVLAAGIRPVAVGALTQQSGSVGVQGKVSAPPPSQAATIDVPRNGQSFSSLPITVSGFCVNGTLVEIYKNNVFSGAAQCQNGSYRLQIDLFDGRNDLVAREYDDLNQAGPPSATVTVTFSSLLPSIGPRISLTSQYSKRGANPGSILNWPVTLSGGSGPYAISIDWGDKSNQDLMSQQAPGGLNLHHTYAQAGIFNVLVKASDNNANLAFLQLVGIGNGPIQQAAKNVSGSIVTNEKTKIAWLPIIVLFILVFVAYWIGQKHQLEAIRRRFRTGEETT
ncbi:PKD domain-containing protein [Candidatus Saccharibacteria bacterium]|nr:PKD domain-containing protein [Candidatus Saccharibacteria bacterium]